MTIKFFVFTSKDHKALTKVMGVRENIGKSFFSTSKKSKNPEYNKFMLVVKKLREILKKDTKIVGVELALEQYKKDMRIALNNFFLANRLAKENKKK